MVEGPVAGVITGRLFAGGHGRGRGGSPSAREGGRPALDCAMRRAGHIGQAWTGWGSEGE